jgi:hypothetical protein
VIPAWKLPLIVAAIAISIVLGFYLGGPGLGMAVGALAATSVLVMAIRHPPQDAIVPCRASDGRARLLLVLDGPIEDPAVTEAALAFEAGGGKASEILVLAPLRQRFLDRWACDTDRAQAAAQQRSVLALGALARAGVEAHTRIGDEDPVQAVADVVNSYPATGVVLVAADGKRGDADAAELRARLTVPFLRLHPSAGPTLDHRDLAVAPARGLSLAADAAPLEVEQRLLTL